MAPDGNPDLIHLYGLQWYQELWISLRLWLQESWTQKWPLTTARAHLISWPWMAVESTQIIMALSHQQGHRWEPRAWASVWLLMVTWAMDISTDHGCSRTTDLDSVLSSSPGPDATMAPSSSAGHSGLDGPYGGMHGIPNPGHPLDICW